MHCINTRRVPSSLPDMDKPRIFTPPANTVEESMKQSEHHVQFMGKVVTSVAKQIIFTVCFRGKLPTKPSKPIAVIQESPSATSESEDEICAIEHVGAIKYNRKGQFFIPMCFNHHVWGRKLTVCHLYSFKLRYTLLLSSRSKAHVVDCY